MPEIKAVVTDLDGTLVTKTNEVILEGLNRAAAVASGKTALRGIIGEVLHRHVIGHLGDSHMEHLNRMLTTLQVDDPQALHRASEYYDSYLRRNLPRRMELINGCLNTLVSLQHDDRILGLTTASPKKIVNEVYFPMMGVVKGLFKYIEAADSLDAEGGRPKPHPYTITKILDAENLDPSQGVMVGDHPVDVEAGQRAGVEPVVVETGVLTRREAEKMGVKYVIPNITFLPKILAELEQ